MKTNELRIGNYISLKSRIAKVGEIYYTGILAYDLEETQDTIEGIERLEGIPITEEWLLKFGFISNPYQDRYEIENIFVECDKTKGFTHLWIEKTPHIKYIHQLQNLYFTLTGEELTLENKQL